jgi:hypothetical protein
MIWCLLALQARNRVESILIGIISPHPRLMVREILHVRLVRQPILGAKFLLLALTVCPDWIVRKIVDEPCRVLLPCGLLSFVCLVIVAIILTL